MKINCIYLCIHYDNKIDFNGRGDEIQPGDMEISYLAGSKKYSLIGFAEECHDGGYGTLVFATDDKKAIRDFMSRNHLLIDGVRAFRSELLEYHENIGTDKSGQWMVLSLAGEIEMLDDNDTTTKYGVIDEQFQVNDNFMREAFTKFGEFKPKLGESGSLQLFSSDESAKIPVLSGTITAICIPLDPNRAIQ